MKKLIFIITLVSIMAFACSDNPTNAGTISIIKSVITIQMASDSSIYSYEFDTLEYHKDIQTLILKNNGELQIFPSFQNSILKFTINGK